MKSKTIYILWGESLKGNLLSEYLHIYLMTRIHCNLVLHSRDRVHSILGNLEAFQGDRGN